MKLWVSLDESNHVLHVADSPLGDTSYEVESDLLVEVVPPEETEPIEDVVPVKQFETIQLFDPFEVFENPRHFKYEDGTLIKDESVLLEIARQEKNLELADECNKAILSGFNYTINNIDYHFSFDVEAQLNFQGASLLFAQDKITELTWTVTNGDNYERIIITKEIMNELNIAMLQHKANNISRYRDILSPKLATATTIEEIQSLSWLEQ